MGEQGFLTVFSPRAKLIQHREKTRGDREFGERSAFPGESAGGDPYFHPAFLRSDDRYVPDPEPIRTLCVGPTISREEINNILVVKLDHIGDCVIAMEAVRRLAVHFPESRITLLAAPATVPLWKALPQIAEVIPFRFFNARSGLGLVDAGDGELHRLQTELNAGRFDLALICENIQKLRHLLLQSGARWLAGFDYQGRFPWLDISLEWEGDARGAGKRAHASYDLINLVEHHRTQRGAVVVPVSGQSLLSRRQAEMAAIV